MIRFLLVAVLLSCALPTARSETICINGRCGIRQPKVVVQNVTVVSAQDHANQLAATNTFSHCGRRGGGYEGLGFSTAGPDAACRNACFWGQRRVREIGTAWCPARRGWVAVVRYE
jgi:hypothetical protein